MKAFILAAGLGTRLGHLTTKKPKALVEFNGKTLLQWTIEKLIREGFMELVINVHHFASQIIDFVVKNNGFGIQIQFSDESAELLDTGGALLHARQLLSNAEDILVYNVDIMSDINLNELMNFHRKSKSLASLSISKRESSRQLLFNDNMELKAWQNIQSGEFKGQYSEYLQAFAFNGIHVIHQSMFDFITEQGKFSVIDLYLRLARNHLIMGYQNPKYQFKDMGKLSDFTV